MNSQNHSDKNILEVLETQDSPVATIIAAEEAKDLSAAPPANTPVEAAINQPTKPILYDATAQQRVPFSVEFRGRRFEVIYIIDPLKHSILESYDKRRNVRLAQADQNEAGLKNAMEQKSENQQASVWLFDHIVPAVEGIGKPGEPLPDNWRSYFSDREKASVIDAAVLACDVIELPIADQGDYLPWDHQEESSTIRLRALYSGYQLVTNHIMRAADADVSSKYKAVMSRTFIVPGSRVGKNEAQVPSRWAKLGEIYQGLHISHEGYAESTYPPLHHQVQVVLAHFGAGQEALAKEV